MENSNLEYETALNSFMQPVVISTQNAFQSLLEPTESNLSSPGLPEAFRLAYGGDWLFDAPPNRPYTYSNFVQSRDGRISFGIPGQSGGGEVSDFNFHDQWIMGLLRTRADAVIVGDVTLKIEPDHIWTHQYICPSETAFDALRSSFGVAANPLQTFLSLEGEFNPSSPVFARADLHVVIFTTARGRDRARNLEGVAASVDLPDVGMDTVDLNRVMQVLHQDYKVKTLLCEGGPRVYGSFVAAKMIDEEFLTLSPVVIGQNTERSRPGLVEGVGFTPANAPRSKPISLKRAGDYLFLRSRLEYR
jgi:riboflavin biosynthesis pyrimidine reductase